MALFQAKIVWKRPRKRENKNYRFVMFLPDAVQKIPKKQLKFKKKKKIPLWRHFKPKYFGKDKEGGKIKIIVSFHPLPDAKFRIPKKLQKN